MMSNRDAAPIAEAGLKLDEFLPYRLSFTSNLVSERVAGAYRELFDLSIPEWRLIAVIAEAGPISQPGIGARTLMDKVTVSRAAIALVGRGLVARSPKPGDQRSHLLDLTADGAGLYARIAPKAMELEARIFAIFSAEERARLVAMLRRIDAGLLAGEGGGA